LVWQLQGALMLLVFEFENWLNPPQQDLDVQRHMSWSLLMLVELLTITIQTFFS
jgi:hypothetical protein